MSSCIGNVLRLSVFGQSHSPAIGCSLDGLPAGIPLDLDALQAFMARRAPGWNDTSTPRREADKLEILGGVVDAHTCGAPFAAIIQNTNTKSRDYSELRRKPRPGHADLTASLKYGNWHDVAGGGHFSGRLTVALCAAGGVALQALATQGVHVVAHIANMGPQNISDTALDALEFKPDQAKAVLENELPCIDVKAAHDMYDAILAAAHTQNSIGGTIECAVYGVPAGLGDPMFDGIENRIAHIAFGIPAVKGVEFGAGFGVARLLGSENNDAYAPAPEGPHVVTNNAGGILGGISTGAPIIWRAALKPTPSIAHAQQTVDLASGKAAMLFVQGRHDPCIVPRAVPVAEAVSALAILDAMLEDGCFQKPDPCPL